MSDHDHDHRKVLEPLAQHNTIKNLMNEEQIGAWILRRLGAPYLRVEAGPDNIHDALEDAKRWFAAKKGVKKQDRIFVQCGKNDYPLTDDMDLILDVAFTIPASDISLISFPYWIAGEMIPANTFAAPGMGGLYSSFTQAIQYVGTARRVLSAEPDWRQEGRTLYIFPIPNYSRFIIVDYKSTNVVVEHLNERDHDLIRRFALSRVMHDVGRIRSKYPEYPTAGGMTSLDGKELLAEADKDMEKLEEEIIMSGFPMVSFFG